MYLTHFGLQDYPFRLSPDPDYLYASEGYAQARSYVDYSLLTRDGFVVITGDVGSGKTTLLRALLGSLPDGALALHVEQTQLTPLEFLQTVHQRLTGDAGSDNKVELLRSLDERLQRAHGQGIRVVLCVDEAQALSFEVLEELRFLTALEVEKDKLISIVLTGQPELREVLEAPGMEQLRQRVRLRFHLTGLSENEIANYVMHRLRVAGAARPDRMIARDAWPVIHRYTGGIPRLINALCDMTFLRARLAGRRFVQADLVLEAVRELEWTPYADRRLAPVRAAPRGASAGAAGDAGALPYALTQLDQRLAGIEAALVRIAEAMESNAATPPVRQRQTS